MIQGQSKRQSGIVKPTVLEREFQDTVIQMAKAFGWHCFYIPDSVRAGAVGRPKGWPDLTLCHPEMNILVFAELKTDNLTKSKLSAEQRYWLTLLSNCGESVQLWRPLLWDHIEKVLQGPSVSTWEALHSGNGDVL